MASSHGQSERTFNIEGHIVHYIELDGDRLWHCECAAFRERLARLKEGFCGHTAVAIQYAEEARRR